eukprot:4798084-Prymnesium_polylepis.1
MREAGEGGREGGRQESTLREPKGLSSEGMGARTGVLADLAHQPCTAGGASGSAMASAEGRACW